MRKIVLAAALMSAAVMVSAPASAVVREFVSNGGFESGTTSPWVPVRWNVYQAAAGYPVHSGDYSAGTGCVGAGAVFNCTISQSLGTSAGQRYDLSFWVGNTRVGLDAQALRVAWNGTDLATIVPTDTAFRQYTFNNLEATSTNTQLLFGGYNNPGTIFIDDVSVTQSTAGAPGAPGPLAGVGLLPALAGAGALFGTRFRRRKPVAA
jgi:hypothetical protein